jgi:hypothetical protein
MRNKPSETGPFTGGVPCVIKIALCEWSSVFRHQQPPLPCPAVLYRPLEPFPHRPVNDRDQMRFFVFRLPDLHESARQIDIRNVQPEHFSAPHADVIAAARKRFQRVRQFVQQSEEIRFVLKSFPCVVFLDDGEIGNRADGTIFERAAKRSTQIGEFTIHRYVISTGRSAFLTVLAQAIDVAPGVNDFTPRALS